MTSTTSIEKGSFQVDLAKIDGDGAFPCPKCSVLISPDDETERIYTILSVVGDEDCLEKVTLQCNKCQSLITLDGFSILNK